MRVTINFKRDGSSNSVQVVLNTDQVVQVWTSDDSTKKTLWLSNGEEINLEQSENDDYWEWEGNEPIYVYVGI